MAGAFQSDAFQTDAFQEDAGTNVTRTATDFLASSESLTRTAVLSRTTAESPTTSDSAVRALNPRTATDSITFADVATRAASLHKTTTDVPTTSDVVTRFQGLSRATTDSPTTSDTAVFLSTKLRTTTEAVSASAAATRNATFTRTVTVAPTTSDVATRSIIHGVVDRSTTEAVSTSEVGSRALIAYRDVVLPLVTSEEVDTQDIVRFATDSLTVSDVAIGSRPVRVVTQALVASDAATRVAVLSRSASEAFSTADAAVRGPSRFATQSIVTSDSAGVSSGSLFRVASESVSASDVVINYSTPYVSGTAIYIDGVNITKAFGDPVLYESARFMSAVNGVPGEASFRVRDDDSSVTYTPGQRLELIIDGQRVWTGFVTNVKRVYAFPALNITEFGPVRFFDIEGTDLNILLTKRIVFNQSTPANVMAPLYGPNTPDINVIGELFENWLDLTGDGIDTSSGVTAVATINEDQEARPWEGSDTWAQAMQSIASLPAAIYYIRPNFEFAYVDTDTPDAPFALTDVNDSGAGGGGTTTYTDDFGRVIASGWGTGGIGVWVDDDSTTATESVNGTQGVAVGGDSSFYWMYVPIPGDLAAEDEWTVTHTIVWPSSFPSYFDFGTSFHNPAYDIELGCNWAMDGGVGKINIYWYNPSSSASDFATISTPIANGIGYIKQHYNFTTGVFQAKAWADGSSEPAYQVQLNGVPITHASFTGNPVVASNGQTALARTWLVNNITLEGVIIPPTPPVDFHGYREMEILADGTNLANDVLAWGAGYGSNVPVFTRAQDATSQTDHGVWQLGQTTFGVYKQSTINRIADSILNGSPEHHRGAKDDRPAVTLVTYETGLLPAQKVTFTSNVFDYTDVLPIRKMEVTFPAPDKPRYELTLSHEIDTPLSFFDPFRYKFPKLPGIKGPGGFPVPPVIIPPIYDPCEDPTLNPFEPFDRTEIGSWDGNTNVDWVAVGPGGTSATDVEDGFGKIEQDGGLFTSGAAGFITTSWPESWSTNFDMTTAFKIDALPDVGWDGTTWFLGIRDSTLTGSVADQRVVGTQRDPNNGTVDSLTFVPGDGDANVIVNFPWVMGLTYNLRWQRSGTSNKIKCWQSTDPEPGVWNITTTAYAFVADRFVVYQIDPTRNFITDPLADLRIWYEYIDFAYNGKPCYCSPDTCTTNLLDEANYSTDWFVISDEGMFTNSGNYIYASIAANDGTQNLTSELAIRGFFDVPRPLVEGGLVVNFTFGYTAASDDPGLFMVWDGRMQVQGSNSTRRRGKVDQNVGDNPVSPYRLLTLQQLLTGEQKYAVTINPDTPYTFSQMISSTAGFSSLVEAGDTVTLGAPTIGAGDPLTIQLDMQVLVSSAFPVPAVAATVWMGAPVFKDLDGNVIDLSPWQVCTPGDCVLPPLVTPGGPLFGDFTEQLVHLNDYLMQITRAFNAGTLRLTVGNPGLLLVEGTDYTVDTTTNQVTLTNPVAPTTPVTATYTATGPIPQPPTPPPGGYTPSSPRRITTNNTVIDGLDFSAPTSNGSYGTRTIFIYAEGTAANPIDNITIQNCRFTGGTISIWLRQCTNVTIRNNVVTGPDYAGIDLWSVIHASVTGNQVSSVGATRTMLTDPAFLNNAYGILTNRNESSNLVVDPPCDDVLISSNIVSDVPLWMCINSHGGRNHTITNNQTSGSPRGIFVAGSQPPGTAPPYNIIVDNNYIDNCVQVPGGSHDPSAIAYFSWTGTSIQHNDYSTTYTNGINNGGGNAGVTVSDNTPFAPGSGPVVPGGGPDWSDDFSGTLSQWNSVERQWAPDFQTTASQAVIVAGNLEIRENLIGGIYKTAMMRTNRTFDHGYFEARMKWPQGTGFDCAFWLRCPDTVASPRPEIDIIEAYPNVPYVWPGPNKYQATMHYVSGSALLNHQITYDAGSDLTGVFHTIGCNWLPGSRMEFFFDGASIGVFTSNVVAASNPMNIVLSIGVGTWSAPIGPTTPTSATMYIDYVKWWDVMP